MSKHTPGPWAVTSVSMNTGNISVGHRDLRIVIAEVTNAASFGDMMAGAMKRGGGGFEQDDCHTQLANARLIAAAPDLLEALQHLSSVYEHIWVKMSDGEMAIVKGAWEAAELAIAKAEGRS